MGALHDGHMSLVTHANASCDFVVVSIFVNPTQFAPNEDLERYPRTLEADMVRCKDAGVAAIFSPDVAAMYPDDGDTQVTVGASTRALCGTSRPGHFEGVATVVTKLLNIVGPCTAVFGRKDYQQWRVIERLVTDLLLPVQLIAAPIVRETDGLALSSRNRYLSADERRRSLALAQGLSRAVRAFEAGERRVSALTTIARELIATAATSVDYVQLADADSAIPLAQDDLVDDRALLAVAAYMGKTRLIDNVVLGEDPAPLKA